MLIYLILLAMFEVKHFLGDYVFQDMYMVNGKRLPWSQDWVIPLTRHCLWHSLFTLIVITSISFVYPATYELLWLVGLDFGSHFLIDRIKGAPNLLGQYGKSGISWWVLMFADQTAHHLFNFYAVYKIGQRIV